MLKTLYVELDKSPAPAPTWRRPPPSLARNLLHLSPTAARAIVQSMPRSFRARGSTSRVRARRPGTSNSIWPSSGLDYVGRRLLRHFSDQRSGAGRCRDRRARRAAGFSDRRAHAARCAHRRRLARHGARHAVPAVLLHHRRRATAEGAGAGVGRRSGRRCGQSRRARRDRKILRRAARSGSPHRGARSVAAAAILDLIVA